MQHVHVHALCPLPLNLTPFPHLPCPNYHPHDPFYPYLGFHYCQAQHQARARARVSPSPSARPGRSYQAIAIDKKSGKCKDETPNNAPTAALSTQHASQPSHLLYRLPRFSSVPILNSRPPFTRPLSSPAKANPGPQTLLLQIPHTNARYTINQQQQIVPETRGSIDTPTSPCTCAWTVS